jgi:hypothetical protein
MVSLNRLIPEQCRADLTGFGGADGMFVFDKPENLGRQSLLMLLAPGPSPPPRDENCEYFSYSFDQNSFLSFYQISLARPFSLIKSRSLEHLPSFRRISLF